LCEWRTRALRCGDEPPALASPAIAELAILGGGALILCVEATRPPSSAARGNARLLLVKNRASSGFAL
jgi:hypothetical protein